MLFQIVCPPALVGSSKPSIWKEMWEIRGAGEGGKEMRVGVDSNQNALYTCIKESEILLIEER